MNYDLLREMLDRHEGNWLKKYRCTSGHWSIGRGWNLDANPLPHDIASYLNLTGSILPTMSDRLLNISIDTAVRQCQAIFPKFDEFSDNRQMALVDFVYNVGVGTALKFKKALAAILDDDWDKAANEMRDSDWYHQVGNRGVEVVDMVREG